MKNVILFYLLTLSCFAYGQTEFKNTVYFGYSLLEASSPGTGGQIFVLIPAGYSSIHSILVTGIYLSDDKLKRNFSTLFY